MAVLSHSSHNPQWILLVQFSLYVHKGGLRPHSFTNVRHWGQAAMDQCLRELCFKALNHANNVLYALLWMTHDKSLADTHFQ